VQLFTCLRGQSTATFIVDAWNYRVQKYSEQQIAPPCHSPVVTIVRTRDTSLSINRVASRVCIPFQILSNRYYTLWDDRRRAH
jgi:hypothetical protein